MQKQGLSLGNYKGIRVNLDYSWFIMFTLVVYMLANYFFPHNFVEISGSEAWILSIVAALLFFISIL